MNLNKLSLRQLIIFKELIKSSNLLSDLLTFESVSLGQAERF